MATQHFRVPRYPARFHVAPASAAGIGAATWPASASHGSDCVASARARATGVRVQMAKAGEAAKARAARRANIKQKKKFKNRNSIGKTRKNVGSAARYITRTQAVKKLQVTS